MVPQLEQNLAPVALVPQLEQKFEEAPPVEAGGAEPLCPREGAEVAAGLEGDAGAGAFDGTSEVL